MLTAPRRIDDIEQIRGALLREPVTTAYMLGDTDVAHRHFCTWFWVGSNEVPEAIVLLYTGLSVPVVLTYGSPEGVEQVLRAFEPEFPGRLISHVMPAHLPAVDRLFESESLRPMLRMGLVAEQFRPVVSVLHDGSTVEVLRLSHRDTGRIIALYQDHPDVFFEPAQMDTGHYYGVEIAGQLAAVAGVHVVSEPSNIACLGNIVTAPEFRGLGLSTVCTSHLCQQLIDSGIRMMALNVQRHNHSAVRIYEKLGFVEDHTYLQGVIRRTYHSERRVQAPR